MKALKLSLLATTMLCGFTVVNAQTVDEIMTKHVAAIGGTDNWNKIKTMKMVENMSQGGMDINITETLAFGKAGRTDISAMGVNGFTIVIGNEGYSYMPFMGPSAKIDTMKPEAVKANQKQMDVKGRQVLDYKSDYTKAEYTGKDTVNNAPCFKVKLTDKDGNESTYFIDCGTYYIVRADSKMKQNDQEAEISFQFSNHKKLDEGIVMPMSISAQGAELIVKSVEINKPIDESMFKPVMPGANTESKNATESKTSAEPSAPAKSKPNKETGK